MSEHEGKRPLTVKDVTVTHHDVTKRAVAAAALGNMTEWYDFGVYSYLAMTVSLVFFSDLPPSLGIVAALGTFAVSFHTSSPLGSSGRSASYSSRKRRADHSQDRCPRSLPRPKPAMSYAHRRNGRSRETSRGQRVDVPETPCVT